MLAHGAQLAVPSRRFPLQSVAAMPTKRAASYHSALYSNGIDQNAMNCYMIG